MPIRVVLKKLGISLLNLITIITITFFVLRVTPGDVVTTLARAIAKEQNIPIPEAMIRVQSILNYDPDEPVLQQFGRYASGILKGDLGNSMQYHKTKVTTIIANAFPWTLLTISIALLLSFFVGTNLGSLMAWKRKTVLDPIISTLYVVVNSIPYYIWPLLLVVVFCTKLKWFPVAGTYSIMTDPGFNLPFIGSVLYHAAMPITAIFIATVFTWTMNMKASAVSVLGDDYITAAYARSVPDKRIKNKYLKRNAMLPLVTQFAATFGMYMGGAIFIEVFFRYTGMGYYMYNALLFRDFTLMQGILIVSSGATIIALLLTDFIYSALDPRVRMEE